MGFISMALAFVGGWLISEQEAEAVHCIGTYCFCGSEDINPSTNEPWESDWYDQELDCNSLVEGCTGVGTFDCLNPCGLSCCGGVCQYWAR